MSNWLSYGLRLAESASVPGITLVACVLYVSRVRSRSAFALLCGAAGVLVMSLVNLFAAPVFARLLGLAMGGAPRSNSLMWLWVASAVTLAFGVLFAVSLILVLRDAAYQHGAGLVERSEQHVALH